MKGGRSSSASMGLNWPSSGNVDIDACSHMAGPPCWTADDGRLWQALQHGFRPDGPARTKSVVFRVGTVRTHVGTILDQLTELGSRLNAPAVFARSAMASSTGAFRC